MRSILTTCALLLFSTACLEIGVVDQTDAGADAGPQNGQDASTPVALDCARDERSGVEICTAVSACPDVWVERDRFPHCGFRPRAGVIDLVCLCDDFVCSMGMASTCEQARALLQSQTELGVCMQVHEGRCLDTQSQNPPSSNCDPTCISECAGNPTCYEFCC